MNSSSSSASGNVSGNNNSSAAANNSASPVNNSNNNSANNYNNYQASQNPGRNNNGLFNSGSVNANLSSNNASQNYSASNASGSTYGSGNSAPTSKVTTPIISYGDMLTSLGVALNNPTLTFLGATNPDAQGIQAKFVLNNAFGLLNYVGGLDNPSQKLVLPSTQEEANNEWEEGTHVILGATGMLSGVEEIANSRVLNNQWLGLNGKWYSLGWGGNGSTGGRILATEAAALAENFHYLSVGLFYVDAFLGGAQIGQDIYSHNILPVGPTAFDITMAGVGTYGGAVGLGISATYFIPKWTIQNWSTIQPILNDAEEMQEEDEEIVGVSNYMRMNKW